MTPSLLLLAMMAISCFFIIKSNFNVYLRGTAIVFLTFSSLVGFVLIQSYIGKPNDIKELPPKVVVYGQLIEKENIYLLYTLPQGKPPAKYIKMPYSESLHKAASKGRQNSKGKPYIIESKPGKSGKDGAKGKKGEGKKGKKGEASFSTESQVHKAMPLPSLVLPDKN